MAAKKKPIEDAPIELAAPAVLRRLQADAAKFSQQIDDAEARLAELYALSPNAAETKDNKEMLARSEIELATARDNFGKTAKILLSYDKGVQLERREGEKVLVDEVKEWFRQLRLCVSIARENYLIGMAQQSPTFKTPVEFMKAHGDLIRSTDASAIDAAVREGQLPKWIQE